MEWAERFMSGRVAVEDNPRSVVPVTAVTSKSSGAIKRNIESDPQITICELARKVGISIGSVEHILNSQLKLAKYFVRWMPDLQTRPKKRTGLIAVEISLKCPKEVITDVCLRW